MKLVRNLTLGFALVATAAFAAVDPVLLNLVPPDAKIISGISVDQSKASRFGQYVLAQMSIDDPGMKKFIVDTGFDPRRDLNEIVLATSGTATATQVVVIGRGIFNPSKILNAAIAGGAIVVPYGNGIQLLTQPGGASKSDNALAFVDASTAVMGSTPAVKAAIDQRSSGARLDAITQAKVRDLATSNDAWFLSTVPVTDFFAGKLSDPNMNQAMGGNLFQSVRSANGGLKFSTNGVTISGEALTRSDQDATALADVIRFVAGLVAQNKDNPQAAQAASLLQSLQLTTQAATLKLTLSVPESVVEQMFMPKVNKKTAHAPKTTAQLR